MRITHQMLQNYKEYEASEDNIKAKAELRNAFFYRRNHMITQVLKQDLSEYYSDWEDIEKMTFNTQDNFVRSFIEKTSQAHRSPIIFKWSNSVNEANKRKFSDLVDEVELHKNLSLYDGLIKLHGNFIVAVKHHSGTKKIHLDNSYDASTTRIIPWDGLPNIAKTIIRHVKINGEKAFLVHDREEMVEYKIFDDELVIENNVIQNKRHEQINLAYWPFVEYRLEDGVGYWANSIGDQLVDMARLIGVLEAGMIDDTIQETMRILIMNFIPTGAGSQISNSNSYYKDNAGGNVLKPGLRNPNYAMDMFDTGGDGKPFAEVVSAELYNKDIIDTIDKLVEHLSVSHNIPHVFKDQVLERVATTAMKLKLENNSTEWKRMIEVFRKPDRELLEKIVEVHNFHRSDNISIEALELDYASPNVVLDELQDINVKKEKLNLGLISIKDLYKRENPEAPDEIIEERLQQNREDNRGIGSLLSLSTPENNPDDEPLFIEEGLE